MEYLKKSFSSKPSSKKYRENFDEAFGKNDKCKNCPEKEIYENCSPVNGKCPWENIEEKVKAGLEQSAKGEVKSLGSFAQYLKDKK